MQDRPEEITGAVLGPQEKLAWTGRPRVRLFCRRATPSWCHSARFGARWPSSGS